MVIVNAAEYQRWIKGEKTIPLADVVDSFEVFHTGQGAQGIMGRPSKQQLDTIFGTHTDTDVVLQILEKGQFQASSELTASLWLHPSALFPFPSSESTLLSPPF
ncbi:DUF1960-domain-containing protein [Violaceomyces palustris]|uniref:DUF1960-domain-containing protein n=1 Tax=Violaceomyces palustris TaxID=1673888 RepID=A0ACD0NWF2_9BASI|nr:DUF1960-domain-containing protein [Violaceomyces palustris]